MQYSDEELLSELYRLGGDGPPTYPQMASDGKFGPSTYERRFGSWNEALQEAGYTPNGKHNVSKEKLLEEIREVGGDSAPTTVEMNEDGKFYHSTYSRRFGSWNEALQEAGYSPNVEQNISAEQLLDSIRELADDFAPTSTEMTANGRYSSTNHEKYFGTWWQAVVRAGELPRERYPLTETQFVELFETAITQQDPSDRLTVLLTMFTGLTPRYIPTLTDSWITEQAGNVLVTVPSSETFSGEDWRFKIPEVWGPDKRETTLPALLTWYFEQYDTLDFKGGETCRNIVFRMAQDMDTERREIDTPVGPSPCIRPGDLRTTGGIKMVRNGAPARRIRRHLGIKHTGWQASVEDFFVWCEVHDDDFSHPDWDGFD